VEEQEELNPMPSPPTEVKKNESNGFTKIDDSEKNTLS